MQTLSFLLKRFQEAGVTPRHQLGQNFLMDMNLQRLLVERAGITDKDVILEVGTGSGGVTIQMAPLAGHVITVELDPQLYLLAQEELQKYENVTMLRQDILKGKNVLAPEVMDVIRKRREDFPDGKFRLVANLPYNVATPIMSNLLALDAPPESMTVTIQKEVADRMVARPGTSDWGALSLWVQCQARAEIVRILPPSVFWPRPKVHSAIIHITYDPLLRSHVGDIHGFHEFIRMMFFHRRKFLRSELLSAYKGRLDKSQIDAVLGELGISGEIRAEQLGVEEMLRLKHAMDDALKNRE